VEVIKHRLQKGLSLDAIWTRSSSAFHSESKSNRKLNSFKPQEVQLKFDFLQKKIKIVNRRRTLLFWISFEGLKNGRLSSTSIKFLSSFFKGKFSGKLTFWIF
jgi:hypothetical protein